VQQLRPTRDGIFQRQEKFLRLRGKMDQRSLLSVRSDFFFWRKNGVRSHFSHEGRTNRGSAFRRVRLRTALQARACFERKEGGHSCPAGGLENPPSYDTAANFSLLPQGEKKLAQELFFFEAQTP
jgi:hypothetical protein